MEQKTEVEAMFDKTSLDRKSWLASHVKADYLSKVKML